MDIKIKEEMEEEKVFEKCGICGINVYKYVCPRCNILYCSVSCYKSQMHLDCSESFYKESIEAELKVQGRDPDAKKKMEEILRRVDQEPDFDSDDSDDMDDLSTRLTGVDLNDAESIWDKLTDEERKEFMELVRNGDATDLVPTWDPWWSSKHPIPRVLELDSTSHKKYKNQCPQLRNVPNLSLITKVEPSPLVYFNLVNIISGYTLIMRYYNGNFENLILEAVTIYLDLTKNFSQNFKSVDSAVGSVAEHANANPWVEISQENISQMKEDTFKILEGPNEEEADFYVRAALSDIHRKLSTAKKEKSKTSKPANKFEQIFPEANVNNMNFVTKDVLNKCIKKIEYFESWTLERYLSVNATQNID